MAEEPTDLTLVILREIRGDIKDMRGDVLRIDQTLSDVRRIVVSHDLRLDAIDEKIDMIREGTVSAIGFAANASRAHVDLSRQIAGLTRRVEKLEQAK